MPGIMAVVNDHKKKLIPGQPQLNMCDNAAQVCVGTVFHYFRNVSHLADKPHHAHFVKKELKLAYKPHLGYTDPVTTDMKLYVYEASWCAC